MKEGEPNLDNRGNKDGDEKYAGNEAYLSGVVIDDELLKKMKEEGVSEENLKLLRKAADFVNKFNDRGPF